MPTSLSILPDLSYLPPPRRRLVTFAHLFFAATATLGALAFVLFLVVFFLAQHHAAPDPAGPQIYRIADHGHSSYVTYPFHLALNILQFTMLTGLALGITGQAALQFLLHRHPRAAISENPTRQP